jgi:hydroxymethylbilane synthase
LKPTTGCQPRRKARSGSNVGRMTPVLSAIDHAPSRNEIMAERALLAALGGTCHSPIAVLTHHQDSGLTMRAALYSENGAARIERSASFALDDKDGPARLALALLAEADPEIVRLFDGPSG